MVIIFGFFYPLYNLFVLLSSAIQYLYILLCWSLEWIGSGGVCVFSVKTMFTWPHRRSVKNADVDVDVGRERGSHVPCTHHTQPKRFIVPALFLRWKLPINIVSSRISTPMQDSVFSRYCRLKDFSSPGVQRFAVEE